MAVQVNIATLLSNDEVVQIRDIATLVPAHHWQDGCTERNQRKHCKHVNTNSEAGLAIGGIVLKAIERHRQFGNASLFARVTRPMLVRYDVGDGYGDHIDTARMGNLRADLACTISINDGHDGGQLRVLHPTAWITYHLESGDAALYPAGFQHHVTPVTKGSRMVIVFWVQSLVRDNAQRELLCGLMTTIWDLANSGASQAHLDAIGATYHNLYRMWSD